MFPKFKDHPVWYTIGDLLLHMLLFITIVAVVVFMLRGPLGKYKKTDLLVFEKIASFRTRVLDGLMLAITSLGNHQVLIPANLFLIFLFIIIKDQHHYTFGVLLLSFSSLLLMFLLKRLFRRKRPEKPLVFAARGLSFPSGHAMMSVCFYGLLLNILAHSGINMPLFVVIAMIIVLLILGIGFSRVYLQVHYASDVLAGFVVGLSWLYVCLHVLDKFPNLAEAIV